MKVGDVVMFVGFPGARVARTDRLGLNPIGIILHVHKYLEFESRYDILWPDGSVGKRLYEETIELIASKETS